MIFFLQQFLQERNPVVNRGLPVLIQPLAVKSNFLCSTCIAAITYLHIRFLFHVLSNHICCH